ncbi:hypothetical protein VKT23_004084 [Stygiomarasmius scandens]|uniref:Uncharacterized protein n=1 Tax=Marasmiellus scandens TaxID=2682957 RepID=A0ABR1JT25_9AGAR
MSPVLEKIYQSKTEVAEIDEIFPLFIQGEKEKLNDHLNNMTEANDLKYIPSLVPQHTTEILYRRVLLTMIRLLDSEQSSSPLVALASALNHGIRNLGSHRNQRFQQSMEIFAQRQGVSLPNEVKFESDSALGQELGMLELIIAMCDECSKRAKFCKEETTKLAKLIRQG